MVELTCPSCELRFPVVESPSNGFCACGLDFEIYRGDEIGGDLLGVLLVSWTPDPEYPASGSTSFVGPLTGPYAPLTS